MVLYTDILASNAASSSTLPSRLVAIFVGATSGIGEITLKKFVKYTTKPHVYFIGRSQEAGRRIEEECKSISPEGQFEFIKADVSLMSTVDEVCLVIRSKERIVDLLFLSAGVPSIDRSVTSENIHLLASLNYYSRIRFIQQLLPLLKASQSLRRVITVGGGGQEGPLDAADFLALRVPLPALRGHLSTLITFGLEAVARTAPEVVFVHDYPGTVPTRLTSHLTEEQLALYKDSIVPLEESGERHVFLATSARFCREEERRQVAGISSGVYSVGRDCESASAEVLELLTGMRNEGMIEKVWEHTQAEFDRIAESVSDA